jgi:hypothetical protein
MAITNGYLTRDEARRYAGLSDLADTELLDDVITTVSRMIDNACQRHFWQTAAATNRVFRTQDLYRMVFGPFNDLVSCSAITFDRAGVGTFDESLNLANVVFSTGKASDNVYAYPEERPYTEANLVNMVFWPIPGGTAGTRRQQLTQITGVWGWPEVPAMVKQACRLQVARIMKRQESPLGVAGFGEFGVVRVSRLDPDVDALLQPYKLLSPGIG